VARRAGLPLASTTYYFSSLDDLLSSAVEHITLMEAAQLRARVDELPKRRRGAEATAEILVDLLVGDSAGGTGQTVNEQLISRYERYIACARQPALREIQRRLLQQRVAAVSEAIIRSGRHVLADLVTALVYEVDGALMSALVDDSDEPRGIARTVLIEVVDVLAPIDDGVIRIASDER
jgi:DNA-binding transcriptional regulator YbjK